MSYIASRSAIGRAFTATSVSCPDPLASGNQKLCLEQEGGSSSLPPVLRVLSRLNTEYVNVTPKYHLLPIRARLLR